ncbi:uncharacterized protein N0V89_006783 [Didymosphaeria variabile]|uniref:Uncharacterized protein n=1 Tax=Didymosphaeria variabile TaxID=1932322 RepID=A0A9W8XJM7_9PLEO|nr:uncharacterized protein N0V89_006783 [Didymosphaeria variabile]KAJ4351441.1 hypothetical protein N0V89_006783 [Didymosphaeria variabile]
MSTTRQTMKDMTPSAISMKHVGPQTTAYRKKGNRADLRKCMFCRRDKQRFRQHQKIREGQADDTTNIGTSNSKLPYATQRTLSATSTSKSTSTDPLYSSTNDSLEALDSDHGDVARLAGSNRWTSILESDFDAASLTVQGDPLNVTSLHFPVGSFTDMTYAQSERSNSQEASPFASYCPEPGVPIFSLKMTPSDPYMMNATEYKLDQRMGSLYGNPRTYEKVCSQKLGYTLAEWYREDVRQLAHCVRVDYPAAQPCNNGC